MILRQYLHTDPVIAASYLLGCATSSTRTYTPTICLPAVSWPRRRGPSTSCTPLPRRGFRSARLRMATTSRSAMWALGCSTCLAARLSIWRSW